MTTTPRIQPRLVFIGGLVLAGLCGFADPAFAAPPTASVKASIKRKVLTVTGTRNADTVALRLQAGAPDTLEIDVNADGSAEFRFTRDRFDTIVVNGAAGDDRMFVDQVSGAFTDTEATTLDGGVGNDTIIGGYGPERLIGGHGDDFIDGQQGADLIDAGDDTDVFQWDPGDGNDIVDGGTGNDRVVFNTSSASETVAVAPTTDGHVRLTRNIGLVTADLDGIETLDLHTYAGNDIVTVADLTGTHLTTINTDLAAIGGGEDGVTDEIVVPPGVPISRDGSAAIVDGLGAQVRVVNGFGLDAIHVTGTAAVDTTPVVGTAETDSIHTVADGTDVVVQGATPGVFVRLTAIERLTVDLLDGDDTFSAVGNLAALTSLTVDGGDGNDTISGSNGADVLIGGHGDDFIDGQQGADLIDAGDDTDVFQWDPGDGNDIVDGGTGNDRVVFNTSSASETVAVAPTTDGHVRLTRNIGLVTADLDGIETLDLHTYAGNDIVTVADLTGTHLTTLNTDLAAIGGGEDGVTDEIVVPPGVPISRDGSAAIVDGLGAQVRVVNGFGLDAIHVTGTAAVDTTPVVGTAETDSIHTVADGTDVVVQGATPGVLVRLTAIERLTVDLLDGDDTFSAVGNLAALTSLTVDGGDGNDTISGSNGADVLIGGHGDDFIDGQQGADLVDAGDDTDVFQWDPGDGNDIVDGGTGNDRVVFNTSSASETVAVAPTTDGHVRLTRNIGLVTADLDGIETLDLHTYAGNDIVTVADLTGTHLTTLNTDLAAIGGGDDGVTDGVIVNGTAGNDVIAVTADGSAVQVQGLATMVRITSAGPTLDRLDVNGLDGDDTITSTPEAGALMILNLLP